MIGMPKRRCLPLHTFVSTGSLHVQYATGNKGGRQARRANVTTLIGRCFEPCPCDKTQGVSNAPDRIRNLGTAGAMASAGRRATEGEESADVGEP
jgi:hypothetical protein